MTTDNVKFLISSGDGLTEAEPHDVLLQRALANLDDLRDALIGGKIKCFVTVGIAPDHTTFSWLGKSRPTTVLEMRGAVLTMMQEM